MKRRREAEIVPSEISSAINELSLLPLTSKPVAPPLTMSLDFTLALLQLIVKDFGRNMEQAVEESYNITLKPWHGWISSAAYKVALKLVPDSKTLVKILKVKDEDDDTLKEDIQKLISLLMPVLDQNKDILKTYGLDMLKST
ncbi:hypothetical protein DH2020_047451 [Rehmannia glutinosa]|uniref:Glycolipid transfer protein domain-containing protein n=1 Tax=Rehmannia glutinosa TaxID=99300 RepID=A0ABR0U944_REHGL